MKKIILGLMVLSASLFADKITVLAAADLKYAFEEVKTAFLKTHPKDEVELIFGSSGKGMHQIENGAPYDIYFSANEAFVGKLYKAGLVVTEPKLYAKGRIVIWSQDPKFDPKKGFDNLKEPWVKKIAIANPTHAPYGEKAKQAMQSIGIYKDVESKLVLGENITQTTQFVKTGAAEIGIIAYSVALAPVIAKSTHPSYHLIDGKLHEPLLQGYGITKVGANKPLTKEFYQYMDTKEAKKIMESFGFVVD